MECLKVLLVDDEVDFSSTLAERMQLRGFDVRTSHSGEEALGCIPGDPPEVVVLDLKMPGLGGLEVLKRIKSEHPGIPVILVTGLGSTKEGMEGMRLGAFDYLMKPVEIDALIAKIQEAAKSSR